MDILGEIEKDRFISLECLQFALKELFKSKKLSLFSYLGGGASGIVLGVRNLE